MMHELNQYMAINACLYWHMPYFEYSAVVDLDECLSSRHGVIKDLSAYVDEALTSHFKRSCLSF
jgi:hypothetical protein